MTHTYGISAIRNTTGTTVSNSMNPEPSAPVIGHTESLSTPKTKQNIYQNLEDDQVDTDSYENDAYALGIENDSSFDRRYGPYLV